MRRLAFTLILLAVAYGLAELAAGVGLRVLRARGLPYQPVSADLGTDYGNRVERYIDSVTAVAFSPDLGWTTEPTASADPRPDRVSAQRLRSQRVFRQEPPRDTVRIAAFGDSFTYGVGVPDGLEWSARLDAMLPDAEVLNFGVPAYGVDQAYLRYLRDGRGYRPDVVLIGFISENINRHVNRFRPFYAPGGKPFSKPRFVVRSGELELLPNPLDTPESYARLLADPARELPRLGEHDYFYRSHPHRSAWDWSPMVRLVKLTTAVLYRRGEAPDVDGEYNRESEAFAVTSRLFAKFVADARADGALPMIVVFPTRGDLRRYAAGEPRVYGPLLRYFDEHKLPYLDVLEAFPECANGCDIDALVPKHYSEAGNEIVARYLAEMLPRRLSWDALRTAAARR